MRDNHRFKSSISADEFIMGETCADEQLAAGDTIGTAVINNAALIGLNYTRPDKSLGTKAQQADRCLPTSMIMNYCQATANLPATSSPSG